MATKMDIKSVAATNQLSFNNVEKILVKYVGKKMTFIESSKKDVNSNEGSCLKNISLTTNCSSEGNLACDKMFSRTIKRNNKSCISSQQYERDSFLDAIQSIIKNIKYACWNFSYSVCKGDVIKTSVYSSKGQKALNVIFVKKLLPNQFDKEDRQSPNLKNKKDIKVSENNFNLFCSRNLCIQSPQIFNDSYRNSILRIKLNNENPNCSNIFHEKKRVNKKTKKKINWEKNLQISSGKNLETGLKKNSDDFKKDFNSKVTVHEDKIKIHLTGENINKEEIEENVKKIEANAENDLNFCCKKKIGLQNQSIKKRFIILDKNKNNAIYPSKSWCDISKNVLKKGKEEFPREANQDNFFLKRKNVNSYGHEFKVQNLNDCSGEVIHKNFLPSISKKKHKKKKWLKKFVCEVCCKFLPTQQQLDVHATKCANKRRKIKGNKKRKFSKISSGFMQELPKVHVPSLQELLSRPRKRPCLSHMTSNYVDWNWDDKCYYSDKSHYRPTVSWDYFHSHEKRKIIYSESDINFQKSNMQPVCYTQNTNYIVSKNHLWHDNTRERMVTEFCNKFENRMNSSSSSLVAVENQISQAFSGNFSQENTSIVYATRIKQIAGNNIILPEENPVVIQQI